MWPKRRAAPWDRPTPPKPDPRDREPPPPPPPRAGKPELVIDGQAVEPYEIPHDAARWFDAVSEENRRAALHAKLSATANTRSLRRAADLFRAKHGRGYNLTLFHRFVVLVRFYDQPDEWGNKWRLSIELSRR